MTATYTRAQVIEATRVATADLKALTDDPVVIQRWLAPRVRALLAGMS